MPVKPRGLLPWKNAHYLIQRYCVKKSRGMDFGVSVWMVDGVSWKSTVVTSFIARLLLLYVTIFLSFRRRRGVNDKQKDLYPCRNPCTIHFLFLLVFT